MIEKEIKIVVDTADAEKNVKDLDKSVEKFGDTAEDASGKASDGLNDVSKANDGVKKSSRGASLGVKAIGTALKAIGIGLVIALVVKFTEVLTSNRKVSDALSTVFETISIVMNQLVGSIVDAITATYEASNGFQGLRKVIGGLITIAITPLQLAFYGIKLAVQEAQLVWEKSFLGDNDPTTIKELNKAIKETSESIKEVGTDYLQAGQDIVSGFSDAVNEVTQLTEMSIKGIGDISVKGAFEQAKTNVSLKNSAEIAAANLEVLVQKSELLAEKQRQIRDDDRRSIKDRLEANEELGRILTKQAEDEKKLINQRIASAQEEKQTAEDKVAAEAEIIRLRGELAAVDNKIESQRSEQLTNKNALLNEQKEILRELNEIGKSELELAREEAQQLRDDRIADIELQVQDEQERARLLLAVQKDYQDTLKNLEKEASDAKIKIAEKENQAKEQQLNSYGKSLSQFSSVLSEETAQGKAFAVASALASTYQGANDALTDKTIPNTFARIAAVASVIGTGLANVKQILSIKVPNGGNSSGGNTANPPTQQQPAFNLVGRSNVNQLQTGLEQQETAPVQAFVVSGEITSMQEADRATEMQASFG